MACTKTKTLLAYIKVSPVGLGRKERIDHTIGDDVQDVNIKYHLSKITVSLVA